MKLRSIIAGASIIASGCSPITNSYSLDIVDFDAEHTAAIVDAANKWVAAVNDPSQLTINVYTGSCDPSYKGDGCIFPLTDIPPYLKSKYLAGMVAAGRKDAMGWCAMQEGGMENGAYVYIDLALINDIDVFSHTVQHELGHMFDLKHTGVGTVMYPYSNVSSPQTDAAQDVTCADVQQYVDLRGATNHCSLE
jgi:hypothetical protein